MFDPSSGPRVFALPPGADFPAELVAGLDDRLSGQPPEALGRVRLIVNTRRMARRIRDLYDAGPPRLLPRISLLTDLGESWTIGGIAPAAPVLRRRLELAQLVARLIEAQPDLAARSSVYDLADSLAELIDEMQGEGVPPETLLSLDVSDMSGHWARAQRFFAIIEDFLSDPGIVDVQARQRRVVETLVSRWQDSPPDGPVILAGSTGSRGTTQMLMQAVARLPQGALVLPGYDSDLPDAVWQGMDAALTGEDHPQFRYRRLMDGLGIAPSDIAPWTDTPAPAPARNRLVSLALRPAPVTDAWMREGPALADLAGATADVTLVEAPSPRSEALAIAMRLRQAAEDGQTAALITPDRMLTRQVTSALDRWGILPDDSAGLPLHLSPPGRFLRHVAELFTQPLTGAALLTLLKHPLTHSGAGRGDHLLHTRDMELHLRRHGPPFPDARAFAAISEDRKTPFPAAWVSWLSACFDGQAMTGEAPLTDWVARLRALAEAIARGGEAEGSGELWLKKAGEEALKVYSALEEEADAGGQMTARDFADLLGALLRQGEVHDRDAPHPHILIWGTLEARVQGADLLILGGLNEATWPEAARPDPWLNRAMRDQAGLLLPERRIGLAAHDFQQATAAREVWLTRAARSDDAETVASRWLNRLTNLLGGLDRSGGPDALAEMRARGRRWLDWCDALERAADLPPAPRPSPRPPLAARPRQLSVTEIKRLIRDPYAIYAKHVLRLRPLDPLVQEPDALLRGIVMHEVLERIVRGSLADGMPDRDRFLATAAEVMAQAVPWPTARRLWLARLGRVADWFVETEIARQARATPVEFECRGRAELGLHGFALTGTADRIDRTGAGELLIYDYKTGAPPGKKVQAQFDKQLLLEAAMAEQGAFEGIGAAPVADALFIGLGTTPGEVPAPLEEEPPGQVWAEFGRLIAAYFEPDQGFTSRRAMQKDSDPGDYDQLARFGEWDRTNDPAPEDLT